MADQRSLSFGVRFGTDTAPLDELNEKQKQVQEEAERTGNVFTAPWLMRDY